MDPLRSRDGSYVILKAEECQSFVEYIRSLSDAELVSVGRDFAFLCERDDPPWEQFEWKRDRCREEYRRRATEPRPGSLK